MQINEIIGSIAEKATDCKVNMKEEDIKKVVTCILIETVSILPMLQRSKETTALVFVDLDGKETIAAVAEYYHISCNNSFYFAFNMKPIQDIPNYEIESDRMIDLIALRCYFFFKMKFLKKQNLILILRAFTSVVNEYASSNGIKSLNIEDFMRALEINTRDLPKLFNK